MSQQIDIDDFPVSISLDVRWGDMDAFGHVNNTVFLTYFESARIEYFNQVEYQKQGSFAPILAASSINYRSPLFYPDRVQCAAKTVELGRSKIIMEYAAWNNKQQLVADGHAVVVHYNYAEKRSCEIGRDLIDRLESLEKKSLQIIKSV